MDGRLDVEGEVVKMQRLHQRPLGQRHGLTGEHGVHHAHVMLVFHGRLEGRLHLLQRELLKVNALEPLVLLDLGRVLQALGRVALQQLQDKVGCLRAERLGDVKLGAHDLGVHLLHVLGVEGRQARQHFEHQRAKAPPVDGFAVRIAFKHLRSKVLGCSTEGRGARVVCVQALLGDAKVRHADVAVGGEQQVLGLEVAVQHAVGVQVLQPQYNLSAVEARARLAELLVLLEMVEQLAAVHKVHDEEELVGCLEGVVEVHQEGVHQLLQDVALRLGVLQLVALDDGLLVEHLHGVDLAGVLLADLQHLAKAALPDNLEELKVV
mmetsp:Transcript_43174/g.109040  ORF Transcript_43174/g.109040 Transcript_43174/m.109040 type:complete len:322 (+) Transcript_43174:145-1110(+)